MRLLHPDVPDSPTEMTTAPETLSDIRPDRMYPKTATLCAVLKWSRFTVYRQAKQIRSDITGKFVSGAEILRLAGCDAADLEPVESLADRRKRRTAARERVREFIRAGK